MLAEDWIPPRVAWMRRVLDKQEEAEPVDIVTLQEEAQKISAFQAQWQEKWRAKWQQKLKEIEVELLEEKAMKPQQSLKSAELLKARPTMDKESATKTRSTMDEDGGIAGVTQRREEKVDEHSAQALPFSAF